LFKYLINKYYICIDFASRSESDGSGRAAESYEVAEGGAGANSATARVKRAAARPNPP
jgi:hypothetical protein